MALLLVAASSRPLEESSIVQLRPGLSVYRAYGRAISQLPHQTDAVGGDDPTGSSSGPEGDEGEDEKRGEQQQGQDQEQQDSGKFNGSSSPPDAVAESPAVVAVEEVTIGAAGTTVEEDLPTSVAEGTAATIEALEVMVATVKGAVKSEDADVAESVAGTNAIAIKAEEEMDVVAVETIEGMDAIAVEAIEEADAAMREAVKEEDILEEAVEGTDAIAEVDQDAATGTVKGDTQPETALANTASASVGDEETLTEPVSEPADSAATDAEPQPDKLKFAAAANHSEREPDVPSEREHLKTGVDKDQKNSGETDIDPIQEQHNQEQQFSHEQEAVLAPIQAGAKPEAETAKATKEDDILNLLL